MNERRDEGIQECIGIMLDANWRSGRTHRELAEKYGVAVVTVRGWAAEASRFLRLCRGNEDEFRERMLAQLDKIAELAQGATFTWKGETIERPDLRNWIAALDLGARVIGVTKAEGGGSSGTPMDVPVEELKTVLESAGYRIEKVSENGDTTDGGSGEGKGKRRGKAAGT